MPEVVGLCPYSGQWAEELLAQEKLVPLVLVLLVPRARLGRSKALLELSALLDVPQVPQELVKAR